MLLNMFRAPLCPSSGALSNVDVFPAVDGWKNIYLGI
jgi:hypothetical protein